MRLPPAGDPGGDAEGALPRSTVLEVLHRLRVSITPDPSDPDVTLLELGNASYAQALPATVGGRLIKAICRNLGLDPLEFYNAHRDGYH
jgi:hypothetical protein